MPKSQSQPNHNMINTWLHHNHSMVARCSMHAQVALISQVRTFSWLVDVFSVNSAGVMSSDPKSAMFMATSFWAT